MRSEAVIFTGQAEGLTVAEIRIDEPDPREVVVAVRHVGLCRSDLHYLEGHLDIRTPAILGHEVAGMVEKVGSEVTSVAPGDLVVASLVPSCGLCRNCEDGRASICLRRKDFRRRRRPAVTTAAGTPVERLINIGGFARHLLLPEQALAVLPPTIDTSVGCLLGCCVVTGLGSVIHGAQLRAGSVAAVIGCGGIGSAIIQGARIAGARQIVAVDTSVARLDAARGFGATDTVQADATEGPAAAISQLCPSGVDYAFEAVGSAETAELALQCLAPGGTATLVGISPPGTTARVPTDAFFFDEKRLIGAYMGSSRFRQDVSEYAELYSSGRLLLDEMVGEVIRLADINRGFDVMRTGTVTRVVVDVWT